MSDVDRIKASILAIARSAFPRLKYLGTYPGRVVSQAADGSLDIRPDDADMPEHQGVPIRYGVPGVTAKVTAGARCALGFAEGDPRKPFAELWESGTLIELKLHTGTDFVVKGTTYRAAEDTLITALNTFAVAINAYAVAIKPVADPTNVGTGALTAAQGVFTAAVTAFQGAAAGYLSTIVKTG